LRTLAVLDAWYKPRKSTHRQGLCGGLSSCRDWIWAQSTRYAAGESPENIVGHKMEPMTPIYRRWNPPNETRLPDIHGWAQDIQSARELANRLSQEFSAENPDLVLLDALSTAAVVRYSRCFTTGIRARLSIEELTAASPAEIDLHQRVCDVRNWHVAHAVNEQEVHALYVILDGSPEATTGAIGFSSFSSVDSPLQPFEASALSELCERWIGWLSTQLIQEQAPLIALANRFSRAELLSLPQDEPQPNPNIRAKRRQIQC